MLNVQVISINFDNFFLVESKYLVGVLRKNKLLSFLFIHREFNLNRQKTSPNFELLLADWK